MSWGAKFIILIVGFAVTWTLCACYSVQQLGGRVVWDPFMTAVALGAGLGIVFGLINTNHAIQKYGVRGGRYETATQLKATVAPFAFELAFVIAATMIVLNDPLVQQRLGPEARLLAIVFWVSTAICSMVCSWPPPEPEPQPQPSG